MIQPQAKIHRLISLCFLGYLTLSVHARAQSAVANSVVPASIEKRVDTILSHMSEGEKLKLIGGNGMETFAIPEMGIPAVRMTDGPSGVRSWGPSNAYPASIALAAAWDPALAKLEGQSLADDAKARGARILLGPGVNIYRAPMNGRNFEYFGENPYLASRSMTV